ncbi:MAG: hypothetical protein ACK452_06790 [Bacteroidota bacterium]|jgi:uncharacterized protein (TIGR02145 family)
MKKLLLATFLFFFVSNKIHSQASTKLSLPVTMNFTYCPGDSVHLAISNYIGTLQWQQSSDSLNWTDIAGANFSPYGFVFISSKYYRAKVTAPNCSPVYSQVQHAVYATNCQYAEGSVFCNGPTAVVDILNPVTGKYWMDRNLGASQVATSNTDALAYGDLYQWGRGSDGHQCRTSATTTTLSSTDQPGNSSFILTSAAPDDWRNPHNTNLWQGLNGLNNPCPNGYRLPTETELNAEVASFSTQNAIGAFASPLKLTLSGNRLNSGGSITNVGVSGRYWSSTVNGANSRQLNFGSTSAGVNNRQRSSGDAVRCIKEPGSIGALNCGSSVVTGNLISGQAASNVSVSVPYTGGNGSYHSGQTVSSTGITGLTATLSAGNFANGSGLLVYNITGTPSTNGNASFALNIGGQSCTLSVSVVTLASVYPAGSVFCNGPTAIVEVTNPATGRTWMDRNLGASQVGTSSTDANSYGDLYQWGRGSDGHQCRTSATTNTLSSSDQPGNSSFILSTGNGSTSPFADWRNPQNTNLWQGVNGVNNPCPTGYRIPTETELDAERINFSTQNSGGAFNSILKLSNAGYRYLTDGLLTNVGTWGIYSSSTVNGTQSRILYFSSSNAYMATYYRAYGCSVRCIKN